MKCFNCNNFIHDLAVVCPYCHVEIPAENRNIPPSFVLDRHPQQNSLNQQNVVCNNEIVNTTTPYNDTHANQGDVHQGANVNPINPAEHQNTTGAAYINPAFYQHYYQNTVSNFNKMQKDKDVPKESLEALCALFPLIGLILYLVNQEKKPNCAKKYGKVALWGLAISGIIYVVSFVLTFLVMVLGVYGLSAGFTG